MTLTLQERKKQHKVIPSVLFGGLFSDFEGVAVYDEEKLSVHYNEDSVDFMLEDTESIALSYVFRKQGVRGLPTIVAYIGINIKFSDGNSLELNTSDYDDVLAVCEILKNKNIQLDDSMKVIQMLEYCKEHNLEFYDAMQKKGKEIAEKYNLQYPSTTFNRTNIK